MRLYHHLGIPTSQPRPGEYYLAEHKVFVLGHQHSQYGVEWMRFEPGARFRRYSCASRILPLKSATSTPSCLARRY
jgi:hypothetical protein